MSGTWNFHLPLHEVKIKAVVYAWKQLWRKTQQQNVALASLKTATIASVCPAFVLGDVPSSLRKLLSGKHRLPSSNVGHHFQLHFSVILYQPFTNQP